jgi:signal transduction histidine kinase
MSLDESIFGESIFGEPVFGEPPFDDPSLPGGIDLSPLVPDLSDRAVFDELLRRSGDEIVVVIADDVAARIDAQGAISVGTFDLTTLDAPVMSVEEYLEVAVESGGVFGLPASGGFEPVPAELPVAGRADALTVDVVDVDGVDWLVAASLDDVRRSVDRVRTALWWTLPISMLIAGALAWLLATRALRPVRLITEQTALINAGTLHERVPVPRTGDEIHTLATTMNAMLDRVQRHDERRRRFISDASHELRSPVAALRTEAEVALRSDAAVDGLALAADVLTESTRLGEIVDDLLALARHDEGLPPPAAAIDLDDIVLDEARRPRRVAVGVGAVSAGRVRARPDEMTRVVRHLLDNAARHASARVDVALTAAEGHVTLTVDDDGPGVPLDQRDTVFERFVRLDDARSRDTGGAGLGLAVVATVARSLGGTVSVGDAPSGGARFAVTLPDAM